MSPVTPTVPSVPAAGGAQRRPARRAAFTAAALAVLVACSGDDPIGPGPDAVPDFSLADVNPNSATAGTAISPRSYLGEVSAWYFGHST